MYRNCNIPKVWFSDSVVYRKCGLPKVWFTKSVVYRKCGLQKVWFTESVVYRKCGLPKVWFTESVNLDPVGRVWVVSNYHQLQPAGRQDRPSSHHTTPVTTSKQKEKNTKTQNGKKHKNTKSQFQVFVDAKFEVFAIAHLLAQKMSQIQRLGPAGQTIRL